MELQGADVLVVAAKSAPSARFANEDGSELAASSRDRVGPASHAAVGAAGAESELRRAMNLARSLDGDPGRSLTRPGLTTGGRPLGLEPIPLEPVPDGRDAHIEFDCYRAMSAPGLYELLEPRAGDPSARRVLACMCG